MTRCVGGVSDEAAERMLLRIAQLKDFAGVAPTVRELAASLGWRSTAHVVVTVRALVARGWLSPVRRGSPRNLRLTRAGRRVVLGWSIPGTVEIPWRSA